MEQAMSYIGTDIQGGGGIDRGGINAVRSSLKGRPGIDILLDTADFEGINCESSLANWTRSRR